MQMEVQTTAPGTVWHRLAAILAAGLLLVACGDDTNSTNDDVRDTSDSVAEDTENDLPDDLDDDQKLDSDIADDVGDSRADTPESDMEDVAIDVPTDSDVAECPAEPIPPADLGPCEVWECQENPAPTCWDCSRSQAEDGTTCTPDGGMPDSGVCMGGICQAQTVTDPGEAGSMTWTSGSTNYQAGDGTSISLTIYLPDGAGPFPVVIFHHGFQLSPADYASYGEHLASWGYVTVMPDMPSGIPIVDPVTHADLQGYMEDLLDWVDANAAVSGGPLEGKADATQIALTGHSLGGKISFLTATGDARPDVIFGIDPVDSAGGPGSMPGPNYPSVTPELMSSVTVPFVVVGETTNATCSGPFCQACAPADENFQQYYTHGTSPALEIEVLGAFHMSFVDNPNCGACLLCPSGTDDPATTRMLTRRYMTAFFNVELKSLTGYESYLTGTDIDADQSAGLISWQAKNGF